MGKLNSSRPGFSTAVTVAIIATIVLIAAGAFYLTRQNKTEETASGDQATPAAVAKTLTESCDIFSQEDATNVMNITEIEKNGFVSGVTKEADSTKYACTYSSVDKDPAAYKAASATVSRYNDSTAAKAKFGSTKQAVTSPAVIATLGEDAFWDATAGSITVLKGTDVIVTSGGGLYKGDKNTADQIAGYVLTHL